MKIKLDAGAYVPERAHEADNSFAYCPSCGAKMENGFEVERC